MYELDREAVRAINRRLDKVDKLTKGQVPQRRRRGKSGGRGKASTVGDSFQLIRGKVIEVFSETRTDEYEEVTTYHYCSVSKIEETDDGPIPFEENSKAPTDDPVNVALDEGEIPKVGDIVWSAYHSAVLTIPAESEYDEEIVIDWWKLPVGDPDVQIVLIDKDIDPGIIEDVDEENNPTSVWDEDTVIVSEEDFLNDTEKVFQDPIPDDPEDYDTNPVDDLNGWGYERATVNLKVFRTPLKVIIESGTAADADSSHITLDDNGATTSNFHIGATIEILNGESEGDDPEITAYDGDTKIATVDPAWSGDPPDGDYQIVRKEPGYDPDKTKLILDITSVLDDSDPENLRRIYRYKTIPVFYDDGKPWILEEFERNDYPDYPENEVFPPDGTGTYQEEEPEFFKKCLRGFVMKGILITLLCKELPPKKLTLNS